MREFTVAGGLLTQTAELGLSELLLVCNKRRDGRLDWTPPGGIVDEGESVVEGLTREVLEETELVVTGWGPQVYEVTVEFAGRDFGLRAKVFSALSWTGTLHVDDPDGVVIDAGFKAGKAREECLDLAPRWVAEPLREWLDAAWEGSRSFDYRVTGTNADMRVERLEC